MPATLNSSSKKADANRELCTIENHERRMDEAWAEECRQAKHLRVYRYSSVFSGIVLAGGSLALCAFGIERHANLLAIAAVIGPAAGLAGVFVWGYRPVAPKRAK